MIKHVAPQSLIMRITEAISRLIIHEVHRRRVGTDDHLAPFACVDCLHRLPRDAWSCAKQEHPHRGVVPMVGAIRGNEVGARYLFLDAPADPSQTPIHVLAVGSDEVRLPIRLVEIAVSLKVIQMLQDSV